MPFSSLPLSSTGLITDTGLTTERLVLRVWTTDEIAAVLNSHRMVSWAEDFPAEGDSVIAGVIAGHHDLPSRRGSNAQEGQDADQGGDHDVDPAAGRRSAEARPLIGARGAVSGRHREPPLSRARGSVRDGG